jgi:hypothetical protein
MKGLMKRDPCRESKVVEERMSSLSSINFQHTFLQESSIKPKGEEKSPWKASSTKWKKECPP